MSSPLNRSSALELIDAIQPLITAADTGILDTYPALLVSANVNYAAYLDTVEGQDPHVIQIARQILDDARTGWSLIESIPHSGSRFIGGGFGLDGFLVGAAVSSGLNALLDGQERSSAKREIAKAKLLWERASHAFQMLKRHVSGGETPQIPLLPAASPPRKPLKRMAGCATKLLLAFLFLVVALAVIGIIKENRDLPSRQPRRPSAPAPKTARASPRPQKPSQPRDLLLRDWDALRSSLNAEYDSFYAAPPPAEVEISLLSGAKYKGHVTVRDDSSITITLSNRPDSLKIPRLSCDSATRQKLWPLPARDVFVRQKIDSEFAAIRFTIEQQYNPKIDKIAFEIAARNKELANASPRRLVGRVLQVVDSSSLLLIDDDYHTFHIVNVDTSRSADGDRVSVNGYYVGMFSYVTAMGSQATVRSYSTRQPQHLSSIASEIADLKRQIEKLAQEKGTALGLYAEKQKSVLAAPVSYNPQMPFPAFDSIGQSGNGAADVSDDYDSLYRFCSSKFKNPVGKELNLQLAVGRLVKGTVVAVDNHNVTMRLSSGALVDLSRDVLSSPSRLVCFRHDYAHHWATERLAGGKVRGAASPAGSRTPSPGDG